MSPGLVQEIPDPRGGNLESTHPQPVVHYPTLGLSSVGGSGLVSFVQDSGLGVSLSEAPGRGASKARRLKAQAQQLP